MRTIDVTAGVVMWHRPGRYHARQGTHSVSIAYSGDMVRDGVLRRLTEARLLAALVLVKMAHQQTLRPPAPDSRPRRCHAKPRGCELVCRPCRLKWGALDQTYPACKGDER